jgi:hypothetical protein
MTGDAMAEQDQHVGAIAEEFPGWETWQGLDGQRHARIIGAIPPVVVHSDSPDGLREQVRGQAK